MNQVLNELDLKRRAASRTISPEKKAHLGQYMTPSAIADFMASLAHSPGLSSFRILDPGAGIGSLSVAVFERLLQDPSTHDVRWIGYEIDGQLANSLREYIQAYESKFAAKGISFDAQLRQEDFVQGSVDNILLASNERFNLAILNPPYRKIRTESQDRLLLHQIGIETVNLYSAFLALTIELLAPGGQAAAIIPRSFCNGPYYKAFRYRLLERAALLHIHLFNARDKAFGEEQVLQENVILLLRRAGPQGHVKVSVSTDAQFHDYSESLHPFENIVHSDDLEKFIHIPVPGSDDEMDLYSRQTLRLADLGVDVSTGPVVDFRTTPFLSALPTEDSVPLLYPGHFSVTGITWPKMPTKKPNAILLTKETKKLLFPTGYYVVVRRFSSKEEQRRIVANVVEPTHFASYAMLGFENHLNVFHQKGAQLPEEVARGLAAYLNSASIDLAFRRFSGHTQVNATDLRLMKYPPLPTIIELGKWAHHAGTPTSTMIDTQLRALSE